jgi:hypothetical protein
VADETQSEALDPAKVEAEAQKQRERDARKQARAVARADDPDAEPGEGEFSRERLLSDDSYALLGHPPYVVAGALDAAGISKKNLTIDEARAAVEEYLAREVSAS